MRMSFCTPAIKLFFLQLSPVIWEGVVDNQPFYLDYGQLCFMLTAQF